MMRRFIPMASTVILSLILVISCSGGNSGPVSPEIQVPANNTSAVATNQHLWGMWNISLDPHTGTAEIIPLRGVEFTCNVTQFLQPPFSDGNLMGIDFDPSTDFSAGYVVVDISFTHPFPGLDMYTGFDVRGVVIGNGSLAGYADTDILYAGPDDLKLLNADGLTRWFNPAEFTTYGKIFGFTMGNLGTQSTDFTATLNAYKYYCNGLDKENDVVEFFTALDCPNPRGYFSAGNTLTRRYELQFPMPGGSPDFRFQYAIIASWDVPDVQPPVNIPDDFPISVNCHEAFAFSASDQSDLYYVDNTTVGGSLGLMVRIFDHQGAYFSDIPSEISAIHLESPDGLINGNLATFDSTQLAAALCDEDDISATYLLEVNDVVLTSDGNYPVLVAMESASPDSYYSGIPGFAYPEDGTLSAYFITSVHVSDTEPSQEQSITIIIPNGGEYWMAGSPYDITWESVDVVGNVKIEFSMDSGATWPVVIAEDTDNDDIESWTPLVEHYTTHGRIKISSLVEPAVFDISDDDFSIDGGWARTWGSSGYDCAYDGIAVDSNGNVYVGGQFSGTCYFDPNDPPDPASVRYSNGNNDCFITKLDLNGNWLWTVVWGDGGGSDDQITAIAIDPDDYVYVAYHVNDGQTTGIQKFDTSGNAVWGWTDNPKDNGPGGWSAVDTGIAADSTGVYWSYYLYNPFIYKIRKYDPTGTTMLWEVVDPMYDDNGTPRPVIIRPDNSNKLALDPSGSTLWVAGYIRHNDNGGVYCDWAWLGSFDTATGAEGTVFVYGVPSTDNTGSTVAMAVDVDDSGHLFVTGRNQGTGVYLAPSGDTTHDSLVTGMADCYMTKFDSTTGQIEPGWPVIWTSTDPSYKTHWDNPRALCLDEYGNAYVSGRVRSDDMQIGSTVIVRTDPTPSSADAFFARFDSDGTFAWAYGFGSTEGLAGWEIGYALFSRGNFVYCGGYFENTVDFAPNGEPEGIRTSNGSLDVWVTKYKLDGTW